MASSCQREVCSGNLGLKGTTEVRGFANGCKLSLVNSHWHGNF